MKNQIACLLVRSSCLAACGLAGATCAAAADACSITVAERAGVARVNEYAVFGVPIPRTWLVTDANRFGLTDGSGAGIPAQIEILARWAGASDNTNAPARWALIACPLTVAGNGSSALQLNHAGAPAVPSATISITTNSANRITIDTGAAQFVLNTINFNLLEQVTVSGQTLLETLGPGAAIAYQDLDSVSVVPGGSPDLTARATSVVVERAGPLYAVVRARGSIMHGAAAVLDYTARLHFYAGRAAARLDFTVENNHPVIPDPDSGQPTNVHNQGAINSVYIGDLRLNLRLRAAGGALHALAEQAVALENPADTLRLFQGSSGGDSWNVYTGTPGWPGEQASAQPRVQSYCTNRGYIVSSAGASITGNQSEGWLAAYRAGGPRITAAMRDFWQNYPQAMELTPAGLMSIVLFPNGRQFHHNFRVGEQKTFSILLDFGVGTISNADCAALAAGFNKPLFGAFPPAWLTNTMALGEVPPASTNAWPLYENYVKTAFTPNPDYDPAVDDPSFGNSTLRERAIDGYDFYGWQDFGDVPLDYEAFDNHCAGQMNLKYWFTYGMFVQFCRSGDMRWLDLALPAARHLSDLDILHIPDEGASHWSHGAYFGHSQHDERGNLNPNRNLNSPSVDLVFGIPDLLLAYYLTGERRFREVALEALVGNKNMSGFSDFTDPLPERERANLVFSYIEGYRETGEAQWLAEITNIVACTASLSNKPWLSDPDAYGVAHPGIAVKLFPLFQVLWAMGKYLDFCVEYGVSDPFGAAAAIRAYCDFIRDYTMSDVGPDMSATVYEYFFDHSDPSYVDHNNWALTAADAMTFAYKYSGISNYLQTAARLYNTGVIDPQWEGDPPVYMDTKGLVNSINWGLVYMNQTRSQPPDPGPKTAPSIQANGVATSLSLDYGMPVTITVALTAGQYAGIAADWWVVAIPNYGSDWYYLDSSMVWTAFPAGSLAACRPAYQGALTDLGATPALQNYVLPRGAYNFYFAVDVMDGVLNYPDGPILTDVVTVTVE